MFAPGSILPSSVVSLRRWLALALILLAALGAAAPVAAEAIAVRATPADGELLTSWPRGIAVSFSEPLDPASTMHMTGPDGVPIEGATLSFGADGATMSLTPPTGLEHGTYTVIWEATSALDGATTPGATSFTVGTAADGAVVTIPSSGKAPGGPPQWLETLTRGVAVLGIAALVAIWPVWTAILRPALRPAWRQAHAHTGIASRFALVAAIVAIAGSIAHIAVQAQNRIGGTPLDKVMNTLGQTTDGRAWIARIVLIVLLAMVFAGVGWWLPKRRPVALVLGWVLALAIPATLSVASHAWDEPVGRAATLAVDYVHTLAGLLWSGGVLALFAVLLPAVRRLEADVRRAVIVRALGRFSALIMVTWTALALSGAYGAWLHIGNVNALVTTGYGRATIVKLVAVAVALGIILFNLLVIRQRLKRGDAAWSGTLRWSLLAQSVVVAGIVVASAQMATQPPARDVVLEEANQVTVPLTFADRPGTLLIAPGAAGVNHLRIEAPGPYLPNATEARMLIEMPERPDLGTRDVLLSRVAGNNFEHHGTEFSLIGDWRITVTLTEPGLPPMTQEILHTFGAEAPERDVPGIPWRFDPIGGVGAVVLLLVGIGGVIAAAYAGRTPLRKEAGGLGLAALALGIVILLQARYDPILAVGGEAGTINENDLAMVARGELVYTDACLSCHGPELRGDGPDAAGLQPPPADFSAPHTYVHSDENLVYWVKNGKQGTAMPGFDNTLTDQEIRDVLAYIKHEQQDMGETTGIMPAAACIVPEMSFADVVGSFNHSIHPEILRETPLVEAVDPEVESATQDEVLFTLEQLVACTNAGNTLSRLPLFTDAQLKDMFPMGMDGRLTSMTTTAPVPLGEGEQVGLQDVQRIRWLADGRIAANVVITDPAGIGVSLDDEYPVISQATFVFLWDPDVGVWLIDEIR